MLLEARSGLHPTTWLGMWGAATLDSSGRARDLSLVPDAHFDSLRSCLDFHETEDHIFVHACYDPDLPMGEQPGELLRWEALRDGVPEPHVSGKTVVVGHTSQKEGEVLDLAHLMCIDTYCHGGGWLTALDVNSGEVWQADRGGVLRRSRRPGPVTKNIIRRRRAPVELYEFECTRHGNVAVLRPWASFLGTPTEATRLFREELHRLVGETDCDIVLDLRSVQVLTKSTSMLVLAYKAMNPRGTRLVLRLAPDLREVFRVTRLDRFFPCSRDLDGALARLAGPRTNDQTPNPADER